MTPDEAIEFGRHITHYFCTTVASKTPLQLRFIRESMEAQRERDA